MKIKTIFIAAVILTALVLMSGAAAADPIEVNQTYFNEYVKGTPGYFDNLGADYVLTENVSLKGLTWKPIGTFVPKKPFTGSFDGQGYTISNLTINTPGSNYVGLFGYSDNASFSNIILKDFDMKGSSYVGSLIGFSNNSSVSNSFVSNVTVNAAVDYAGGLVGYSSSTFYYDCSVSDVISEATGKYAGGLIGYSHYSRPHDCSIFNVTVEANKYAGGLIGYIYGNGAENCFVNGDISVTSTTDIAGGFAGYMAYGSVDSCSVSGVGSISGKNYVGGFIGQVATENIDDGAAYGYVTNCSVSNIAVKADESRAGGLVGGFYNGTIRDCYSLANVEAPDYVGGITSSITEGANFLPASISSSYFAGTVKATANTPTVFGGIVGLISDPQTVKITDCVYLDTAGTGFTCAEGKAVPAEDMKKADTFKAGSSYMDDGSEGWSILSVPNSAWYIYEGLPSPQLVTFRKDTIYISNADELQKIGTNYYDSEKDNLYTMKSNYILTKNINLSGVNWVPIGTMNQPQNLFTGTFEGSGYTISNLHFDDSMYYCAGLFGAASNASFSNVTLKNFNITGMSCVGSLAGYAGACSINNVSAINCNINGGYDNVGGLVGWFFGLFEGFADNCSASGNVTGGTKVGGLFGDFSAGSLQNSYAECNVTASHPKDHDHGLWGFAGGLAGSITESTVSTCYTAGTVTSASNKAGGLFGMAGHYYADYVPMIISNCYSLCDVTAKDTYAGGLIGLNGDSRYLVNSISNCYFAGAVYVETAGGEIGGIVGGIEEESLPNYPYQHGYLEVTNSLYLEVDDNYYTNPYGNPAPSKNMKKIASYQENSDYFNDKSKSWDIVSAYDPGHIWYIKEGKTFPLLSIFYVPPSNGGGDGTGSVEIVDPDPVTPGAEGNGTGNATHGSGGIGGGKIIEEEEGYGIEEEISKIPCLLWLLLLLLLLLLIAYYLYRKSKKYGKE